MRVAFTPPSVREYALVFRRKTRLKGNKRRGYGLNDIRVFVPPHLRDNRGGGLFSILSGLTRKAVPFIMRNVAPAAVEFGKNVMTDVLSGDGTVRETLKKRGVETLRKTGQKLLAGPELHPGIINKKKKKIVGKKKKKKKMTRKLKKDVFDV